VRMAGLSTSTEGGRRSARGHSPEAAGFLSTAKAASCCWNASQEARCIEAICCDTLGTQCSRLASLEPPFSFIYRNFTPSTRSKMLAHPIPITEVYSSISLPNGASLDLELDIYRASAAAKAVS
jgi:hypothetical protein